jgi:hypothetical protein
MAELADESAKGQSAGFGGSDRGTSARKLPKGGACNSGSGESDIRIGRVFLSIVGAVAADVKSIRTPKEQHEANERSLSQTRARAMKAAEDSRTPRPRGRRGGQSVATASWSAAVLCRFDTPFLGRL